MDNRMILVAEGVDDTTGIACGANLELEVGAIGEGGPEVVTDDTSLFFSGGFGRVELGQKDGAEDVMMLGGESIAAGTGGIDGDLPINLTGGNIPTSDDAAKVTYFTPRLAGFQAGVSYAPDVVNGGDSKDFPDERLEPAPFIGAGVNFIVDHIALANGTLVPPYSLTCAVEAVEGMQQYHFVRTHADVMELRVVPNDDFGDATQQALLAALRPVLPGVTIHIRTMPSIPSEPSGKYRIVQSRVSARQPRGVESEPGAGAPLGSR